MCGSDCQLYAHRLRHRAFHLPMAQKQPHTHQQRHCLGCHQQYADVNGRQTVGRRHLYGDGEQRLRQCRQFLYRVKGFQSIRRCGLGRQHFGQTNVPSGLTNAVAIAGGAVHSLALKSDGTVVAWGDNNFGQTNVPTDLTNVVAIAAGYIIVWRSRATARWWAGATTITANQCSRRPDERGGDCCGLVSQSGAQERRHGGGLGRQHLRPDQCSIWPDERGGDCCGLLS